MKKFNQKRLVKKALVLSLSLILAFVLVCGCSAASLNIIGFGRRNADTSDAPPIGEGLESGAEGIVDGIESGADGIMDGIESGAEDIIDGAESIIDGDGTNDMTDGMTDEATDEGGFETNVPDSDIGGALEDDDSDGISDPTDPDDDNDGTPDAVDSDADNDGITDDTDPDPDGDGVDESKMSGTVVGIIIAVLVVGAIAVLVYALMPKKKH